MTQSGNAAAAGTPRGWQEQAPLEIKRGTHDQATVDGRILVCGGFNPNPLEILGSVEARRVQPNGTWRPLASMTPRANVAAAELDGVAYVAGGFVIDQNGDDVEVDVVEQFDPRVGSWRPSPKMPDRRAAASAAGLGGLLYVAGGFIAGAPTDLVIAYDPRDRTWTEVAPMPTARTRLRLIATGGHLFAIGGQDKRLDNLATVERYEPRTNTWTGVASMNEPRGVPGAVAISHGNNRLIVVVGGAQAVNGEVTGFLDTTEVYDPDTDRWHTLRARLPVPKAGLICAAEIDGTVLAIGGGVLTDDGLAATREVYALKVTGQDA